MSEFFITVTDNVNVVRMWSEGKNARNRAYTLASIDGSLVSFHHKIGHRTERGTCIVADLKFSQLPATLVGPTLDHIKLAKSFADTIFHELVSECSPLFMEEVPF